jgi:hypothetical protein
MTIEILLMIAAGASASVLCNILYSRLMSKRRELLLARNSLERHFKAIETVVGDTAVPEDIKVVLTQFSSAIGQKAVAREIAYAILRNEKPVLSEERRRKIDSLVEELRRLSDERPDLANAIVDVIEFGFAAMVLRWPETDIVMANVVMLDAEANQQPFAVKMKAERVLSKLPERASPVLQAA